MVSGLAVASAFEPLAFAPGLIVGLVGFFWATCRGSLRRGLLLGWLFGAAYLGAHLLWLRSVGWDAWALLAGLQAAFYGPLGAACAAFGRTRWWPVLAPLGWVSVETVRGSWPLGGMPWGRLAFATPGTVWDHALPYVGASGVALLLSLTSALLAWLLVRRPGPRTIAGAIGLPVALTLLPVLMPYDTPVSGTATVAVVQGNVPGDGTNILYDYRGVTRNHRDATVALAADIQAGKTPQPDVVIWPENSTAIDPFRHADMTSAIEESVQAVGVPILVGAIADHPEDGRVLNQGIVWDPASGPGDRYTKHHPVPFGEYIPWRDSNPLTSRFERFALISRDMVAGTGDEPLRAGGIEISDAMCFDIAFDDVVYPSIRRGGEVLAVQTSNATYINTEQIAQQFQISRARAIETGRWTAIAATNGVTGIIRPDGSVVQRLARKTQGYVVAQADLATATPPGVLIAPWVSRAAALVTVLALLVLAATSRRHTRSSRPVDRPAVTLER